MKLLSDTSPEAERVLTEVIRRLSPSQRWSRLGVMYREARVLHAAGARLRNPAATPREIVDDWIAIQFGVILPPTRGEDVLNADIFRDLYAVLAILGRVGIAYSLGGSMALAVYSMGRQTNDADLTVEPFPDKEGSFLAALGKNYYVSPEAVASANRRRASFNIIDQRTGFKIDFFVRPLIDFDESAWSRRRPVTLTDQAADPVVVQSPEDLVLFKLRRFRRGGEVSDLQWRDVTGLLKILAGRLDNPYLDHWASRIGVTDLLARARQEIAS